MNTFNLYPRNFNQKGTVRIGREFTGEFVFLKAHSERHPVFAVHLTPAEARQVADALVSEAVAAEKDIADRKAKAAVPEFEPGAIVRVDAFTPFMLRSDYKWVSSGLLGPTHDEIVKHIAKAHDDRTLEVLYSESRDES